MDPQLLSVGTTRSRSRERDKSGRVVSQSELRGGPRRRGTTRGVTAVRRGLTWQVSCVWPALKESALHHTYQRGRWWWRAVLHCDETGQGKTEQSMGYSGRVNSLQVPADNVKRRAVNDQCSLFQIVHMQLTSSISFVYFVASSTACIYCCTHSSSTYPLATQPAIEHASTAGCA